MAFLLFIKAEDVNIRLDDALYKEIVIC